MCDIGNISRNRSYEIVRILHLPLLQRYISRNQYTCTGYWIEHAEGVRKPVPVEFLTAEQLSRFGCYVGEPSPEQLALYFHLDDRDRALLEPRRHPHTSLGFVM